MINHLSIILSGLVATTFLIYTSYAQWPLQCNANAPGYSAWNYSNCPTSATCCPSPFSQSGVGCCPYPNAVCCPDSPYLCCPSGTKCRPVNGSSYNQVDVCYTPTNTTIGLAASVCKYGPPLPYSTTLKNVLIIGDSVSIGYTPHVATALSDIALVQHAPWGGDGGAEETAYGIQCLDYFLHSPSGMDIEPDLVYFNWGLHDGPMQNATIPGQNGDAMLYLPQLTTLVEMLVNFTSTRKTKLIFGLTSGMICNVQEDGCVITLNNGAKTIMEQYSIPTVDLHAAIINKCGPAPQASCFNETGCFCPHCVDSGYQWLANSTVAPAIRNALVTSGQ